VGEDVLDPAVTLRALRRRADLSQRELADLAGLPKSTITRIESGEIMRAGRGRWSRRSSRMT
jgi:transcriptional regulator with XRE-family HTH domain